MWAIVSIIIDGLKGEDHTGEGLQVLKVSLILAQSPMGLLCPILICVMANLNGVNAFPNLPTGSRGLTGDRQ
jgi:hypothetical protein